MPDIEQANAIKERHSERLLRIPGVSGVGVERAADGNAEIVVHLDAHAPPTSDQLPAELEGCPVRYTHDGPFTAFAD